MDKYIIILLQWLIDHACKYIAKNISLHSNNIKNYILVLLLYFLILLIRENVFHKVK